LSSEEIEQLYQDATLEGAELAIAMVEDAVAEKEEVLEKIEATLEKEWTAYDVLAELLETKEYGYLDKSDIVKAQQKIHLAMQHQEQSMDALEKSIEKLEDALSSLGVVAEPEPEKSSEGKGKK